MSFRLRLRKLNVFSIPFSELMFFQIDNQIGYQIDIQFDNPYIKYFAKF